MITARAFIHQAELESAIQQAQQSLGADVVRVRYSLGEDWSGDPAIFFRVLLSDRASQRDALHDSASRVRKVSMEYLQPIEKWDVLPYFSFRSASEQARMREEAWA